MHYHWPGNVRELENIIERLMAAWPLPPQAWREVVPELSRSGQKVPEPSHQHAPAQSSSERDQLLQALARTAGDKTQAATLLGIGRTTLWRKLKQYGLS